MLKKSKKKKIVKDALEVVIKPRPPLKPYLWHEMKGMFDSEPLVKGILDCGKLSVIYGPSNSAKTFLALDIAAHIVKGKPWHGKKVKQGSVLYIAAEGGASVYRRIDAFHRHRRNLTESPLYVIAKSVNLGKSGADKQAVIDEINQIKEPSLLIVDTLSRTLAGGDENSSSDMGAYIKNCTEIQEETGIHVMVIHHTGKDAGKGARGHSNLRGAADTMIEVKQKGDLVTATVDKQRDGETGIKFCLRREVVDLDTDDDGQPIRSCVLSPTTAPIELKELKGRARIALDVLQEEIAIVCKSRPENSLSVPQIPKTKFFASLADHEGFCDGATVKSTISKACTRALTELIEKEYAQELGSSVSLSPRGQMDKHGTSSET